LTITQTPADGVHTGMLVEQQPIPAARRVQN